MSDLTRFAEYARTMAQGGHADDCGKAAEKARDRWIHFHLFREWHEAWGPRPSGPPTPCKGECLTDADRALFGRLAAEVDEYLDPHPELF